MIVLIRLAHYINYFRMCIIIYTSNANNVSLVYFLNLILRSKIALTNLNLIS